MRKLDDFGFGTQIRKSPFFDATLEWGATGFSVYNHMYIPRDFGDPEQNFWNLVNDAILCDVSVERQVEISGPDAAKFVQLLTPRDLSKMKVGQCKYILITNQDGGLLNDPVLLKLADNRFWISLADSDILLWAQGVAVNTEFDVNIFEPDASPLQLQGPKSRDIMVKLFDESILDLKYYWHREYKWNGISLVVSRTGWSSELGYEIFLTDKTMGRELWNHIMLIGEPMGLKPGHTSSIRRIEGAMLSYHADADITTNPFELGLDRLVNLNVSHDFIGKKALQVIKSEKIKQRFVMLTLKDSKPGSPLLLHDEPIYFKDKIIGRTTSGNYSFNFKKNLAFAYISNHHSTEELSKNDIFIEVEKQKYQAQLLEKPLKQNNFKNI